MFARLFAAGAAGLARRLLVTFWAALLTVSVAWAGAILAPAPDLGPVDPSALAATLDDLGDSELGEGRLQVGASRVSIYPRPDEMEDEFEGATWLTDVDACTTLSESFFSEVAEDPAFAGHVATATANPWPENPDCLYSGGFGIGPTNPIVDWDRAPGDPGYVEDDDDQTGYGLWVRTVILSDGTDEVVLTVIDAEGYLYEYNSKCETARRPNCGARGIAEQLGAELGIDPDSFVIAATHSHAAPDLIGGWGFVPDWYFAQVVDAIHTSIREAHADMQANTDGAIIEVGEERARQFNHERRDTYRSAEEQQLAWLRALDAGTGETIATIGSYAGHPTSYGTNDNVAHADWVGVFERRLEDNHGGIGMHFMTGLATCRTAPAAPAARPWPT